MRQYKDFQPTGFDPKGLGLEDRQSWFVMPVSQTRDSEVLDKANFKAVLDDLKENHNEDLFEVHRFGHWANGYFELILVHPSLEDYGNEVEGCLENYPVYNDSLFSEMEEEQNQKDWRSWGERQFIKTLCREFALQETTKDWLEQLDDASYLYEFHCHKSPYNEMDFDYLKQLSRNDVARLLRDMR